MIGTYVPAKRTPVTPDALRDALRACLAARGIDASEHALNGLVAMSAHETGVWRYCYNYNLGNVKAGATWPGLYTCLNNVWEVLKGKTRWFSPRGEISGRNGTLIGPEYPVPPGHPQTRFRAYATLTEGIDGWVAKMLSSDKPNYRAATDLLLAGGSTDVFVAKLRAHKYFTGNLVKYQASVRSYYREFSDDLATVAGVQRALVKLGYDAGKADGVHGPRTTAAVIAFQRNANLKPDGVVGPITRDALRVALKELP